MKPQSIRISIVLLALGWLSLGNVSPVFAEEADTHEGLVVSAGSGRLSMTANDGKQQSYDIGEMVKITVNGRMGRLEDLKVGSRIRVTTDKAGRALTVATVDALKTAVGAICSD